MYMYMVLGTQDNPSVFRPRSHIAYFFAQFLSALGSQTHLRGETTWAGELSRVGRYMYTVVQPWQLFFK